MPFSIPIANAAAVASKFYTTTSYKGPGKGLPRSDLLVIRAMKVFLSTSRSRLQHQAPLNMAGTPVSFVARRHGLAPNLVFRWRRLMSDGGRQAVRADDDVVPASEARRLEERVREHVILYLLFLE